MKEGEEELQAAVRKLTPKEIESSRPANLAV